MDLVRTITDALFDQGADISPVSISRLRRIIQQTQDATMNDIDAALRRLARTGAVRLHRSTRPSPFHDLDVGGDYYSMIRLDI